VCYERWGGLFVVCLEGTGTWPDYLVNRDDQKNEGPFGEIFFTEIKKLLLDEWSGLWVHRDS